jgi:hypothetical protein
MPSLICWRASSYWLGMGGREIWGVMEGVCPKCVYACLELEGCAMYRGGRGNLGCSVGEVVE